MVWGCFKLILISVVLSAAFWFFGLSWIYNDALYSNGPDVLIEQKPDKVYETLVTHSFNQFHYLIRLLAIEFKW